MQYETPDITYKIILVGNRAVGKTSYICRFVKGIFINTGPTIGVEMESKILKMKNGKIVKTRIWDTSGQEKYKSITTAHYNQSAGALLFFSLDDLDSFKDVIGWISEIRENAGEVTSYSL